MRSRQPLPRIVKQLGAVSFFNDLASEMVYPLLPALMTVRLGGTALTLGALDGIADAMAATVKLASGWLAERLRWRGPLVVGGYAVAAAVRPVMGVVGSAWQVIALRAADRLGKGVRNPPRDAVIADASPGTMRGRAFGFHRAMDHAGAVVGPVVAWVLIAVAGSTPAEVIVWSVVPGLLAVGVVAWAMGRVRAAGRGKREAGVAPGERDEGRRPPDRLTAQPSTLLFGLIVAFAFARFPETLFLLRLQDLGVAIAAVPVLWAALHLVRSAASYPGGWLSDHLGPRPTMLVGWLLYAAVCFGLATAETGATGALWFLAFGLVAATTESPERAFIAASARVARRGRHFGLYHASVGMAALPGSLMFGAVYVGAGAPLALAISGGLVLALFLVGSAGGWRGRARA
ncbi:MAG: MFS transporter [Gemmatimonadales bacterium]|nr:MFS transporter [Gemmatimonadales bacterium]NIN49123.1 MFS transporter [Gemmatimonadales bacterium]NIP06587.1 MFS transporter [Gemmatimonadales bacterium]NIR00284.1 MFS transporter [Gemmatimonadales bacterium]NIS64617.1 MFS transporter [Gemmatimonadales bacterium]